MFEALDLACYIKDKYKKQYTKEISPLKLHKILYFLFGYWGGFISKGIKNNSFSEIDFKNYNPILFNDKIEAWTYGPVVINVYEKLEDYEKIADMNMIKKEIENKYDGYFKEFLNDILKDTFKTSDFKLVSISQNDLSWKNNYNANSKTHKQEINHKEIISEYLYK